MAELDDSDDTQFQSHQQGEDEYTLKFLDSLDNYMTLIDSLSSTLGQAWFQLASARHSMGAFRINSALLNLKPHDAATQMQVTLDQAMLCVSAFDAADPVADQQRFTLCKWISSEDGNSGETGDESEMLNTFESFSTQDNSTFPSHELQEESLPKNLSALDAEKRVQRERSKSLAVFGTLVPPRLRDSQLSFEKALETIVEIANARSSILSAFDQLQKDTKRSQES